MSVCTCGRGEVFHPPFHDESCAMYEASRPPAGVSEDDVQVAFAVIRKLQGPVRRGGYRLTVDEARVALRLLKAAARA